MDENVHGDITTGLVRRGADVIIAEQDGHEQTDDEIILARAGELNRLLFTQDVDLLIIAARWQRDERPFAGVVFAQQGGPSVAMCIDDLALIAEYGELDEYRCQVTYLPLLG